MSKMDALRAMREAKYEQRAAAAPKAGPKTATDALCGHRNLSGRTCTREEGHAAKSHRYS